MSIRLSVRKETKGRESVLWLKGSIVEGAAALLSENLQGIKTCMLDLGEITIISSVGVREWVGLMGELEATVKLTFRNCPLAVLAVMATVPDFRGAGQLESARVDFRCDGCGAEKHETLSLKTDFAADGRMTRAVNCSGCKARLSLPSAAQDVIEDLTAR